MKLVEEFKPIKDCYCIPHHGVSTDQKKYYMLTVSGMSSNDILLKGKILQQDLFLVMIHFQKHQYAFTANVQNFINSSITNKLY